MLFLVWPSRRCYAVCAPAHAARRRAAAQRGTAAAAQCRGGLRNALQQLASCFGRARRACAAAACDAFGSMRLRKKFPRAEPAGALRSV